MGWAELLAVVLTSSVVSALVGPIATHMVSERAKRRDRRAERLAAWRRALRQIDLNWTDVTALEVYPEIASALRAEGIDLHAIEGRTAIVPPDGFKGNMRVYHLLEQLERLERRWKLR